MAGLSLYCDDPLYFIGLLNSIVLRECLLIMNPTINYPPGTIAKLPTIRDNARYPNVTSLAKENICLSKDDWDSYETSWDFKRNPLV